MHVISDEVTRQIPELDGFHVGVAHFFLQHTSAGLCVNEAVEPAVRHDLAGFLERLAPDAAPHYTHRYEGPDDMPAHIKTALVGCSVTVPVTGGRLALGSWQGLYLCEFRNNGEARLLNVTIWGEQPPDPQKE
jgi:secondary thiamine-phosphate synthase enzyme